MHLVGGLEQKQRTQSLQEFLTLIKSRYTSSVPTKPFTHKQGQYLAFIHYYSKVNGRPPAEADMQRYFRVSPPSIHQMVLALEANGFIERVPGQGRSIRLLIPREALPDLE
jgi:DNA-binding MarR family transcriptional regulator